MSQLVESSENGRNMQWIANTATETDCKGKNKTNFQKYR